MPYTDGWTHRIKLTIPASKIDADVLNPVVPVKLSATALASVHSVLGSATTNRKKCAFASMSGTYYYAEIKDWLTGCFFVATDTLNSVVGNEFYFYMSATAVDSVYMGDAGDAAAQAVWPAVFKAVYNFEQDPSISDILDSTANGNNAISQTTMLSGDRITSGFGNALDFDGTSEYLETTADPSIYIIPNLSVIAFVNRKGYNSRHEGFLSLSDAAYSARNNFFVDNTTYRDISYWSSTNSWERSSDGPQLTEGQEYCVVFTAVSGGELKIYVDGILEKTYSITAFPINTDKIRIATTNPDGLEFLWGSLSHLSITSDIKPIEWIEIFSKGLKNDLLTFTAMEGADTIRELIITSIKANLSNITTTNGYNTNAGNLVVRSTEIGGLTSLPGIAIAPGNDTQSDLKSYGYDTLDMPVEITIADTYTHETTEALNKNAVSQKCEQLLGDLRKAMAQTITNVKMVSYTEGGVNSYPLERNNEMAAVVAVTYTIKYETIKDDPYNQ